jgi:hypothetical protein
MALTDSTGPVKFLRISQNTAASFDIVALVATKKIRVLAVELTSAGIVGVSFKSKVANTTISGVHSLVAAAPRLSMPFNPCGHFETVVGEVLQLVLDAAILVAGHIVYQEVS